MQTKLTLIRDVSMMQNASPCIATIGNFDGLHLGHQAIIKKVVTKAQQLSFIPTVITFEPAPQSFLRPDKKFFRLMSFTQKLEILAEWGIRQVICLRFNRHLAGYSPLAFMQHYLVNGANVRCLLVGEDFRFGHQQEGDVQTLLSLGSQFDVEIEPIKHVLNQSNKISSTLIRQSIVNGDMEGANSLLGRKFSVKGRVVKGAMRGRQLGFATANLPCTRRASHLSGVFVTKVHFDHKTYLAATNIGKRPTFNGENRIIEAHVLDFSGNLYGKKIEIEFLHKLRDEKRFTSIDLLIQQIKSDIEQTRDFFINTPMEV